MKLPARGAKVSLMNRDLLILRIALVTELAGGALLGLGIFSPLAGTLLVGVTASLVFVSWPHEYPLYLLFAAVAIALSGGTGILGVGLGLAVAVTIEGGCQVARQRTATGGSLVSALAPSDQENP
jgi:uncharacterized membrane protein YphA (DoxX/SURF4 family)